MRCWGAIVLAALLPAAGCAGDDPPLSPVDSADGSDSGEETGDEIPDPCAVSGEGDGTGESDDDGPKLDVSPDEYDLPKTCAELEAHETNVGCEFWAVDLPNDWQGTDMSPPAADQAFAVVVANASSMETANVAVYFGSSDLPLATAMVPADGTHTFDLGVHSIDPQQSGSDGTALRIESDVPITAYQFNPLDNQVQVYSNDASLLFPTHALGTDYAAITGDAVFIGTDENDPDPDPAGAFVSVVATEDDTLAEVFPSGALLAGSPTDAVLDRGQVLTVLSDAYVSDNNLSGTRVRADKPIAVFSGNVATVEPIELHACCADHLEHQMLPFEAWSDGYAVAPPPSPLSGDDPAVYRLVAAFDDTKLVYCPLRPEGAPTLLDSLETGTFVSSKPFTVKSADPERPIAIAQFLESNSAITVTGQPGDPAMIALPAAAQFQYKYVFAIPPGYAFNFVTIVARGAGDIELDGAPVDKGAFADLAVVDGVLHRYAHRPLAAGSHRIDADVPVGITVVGYDTAVSFGFPGGVGLKLLAPAPPVG